VKIKKSEPFLNFKKMIAEKTGIPPEHQRFWKWEQRQNRTTRPDSFIKPIYEQLRKIFYSLIFVSI
jgi:hypothetical protein